MFSEIIILITAIIFFFIGFWARRGELPEKIEQAKEIIKKIKRVGPVVVETDEAELERREEREEKEIIDLKDFPK